MEQKLCLKRNADNKFTPRHFSSQRFIHTGRNSENNEMFRCQFRFNSSVWMQAEVGEAPGQDQPSA